jgi:hypothetical protein
MTGNAAGSTRSRLTQLYRWRRDLGAVQHVKRAAIPTYKCSINYSITSWAVLDIRVVGVWRFRSLRVLIFALEI